ncbi:MAG: hypothetical protein NW215_07410 [Hyphomicrobiales bacterium]|nr:hypothetical protein [Hyphomicrobiales bacterium]
MCGRFTQTNGELPGLEVVVESACKLAGPRYNGAPSQDFWAFADILKPGFIIATGSFGV